MWNIFCEEKNEIFGFTLQIDIMEEFHEYYFLWTNNLNLKDWQTDWQDENFEIIFSELL